MLECHTASSAEHIFNNIDKKLVENDILELAIQLKLER